ncbi:hypothetical protein, partial [Pararhizobium sp. BT-229]|uniref:hypothetical protein n=1 Tax=Pararhizobium sp. BT-229 TaxID=2986923 RepID=UPI0021F778A5
MSDRKEAFRKRVISALDLGVAASFAWVVATAWFGVFGVRTMSTQVVQQTVGWYGKTVSLWEANTVYAFLGYAVLFHIGMLTVYWLVRRGRPLAPTASDILAITVAGASMALYLPGFLAMWQMTGIHAETLSPTWLSKFVLQFSPAGDGEEKADLQIASMILQCAAWAFPTA